MRDPEMYNYVKQVLETMKEHNTDLEHALAMHGNNMTKDEVSELIAETREFEKPSDAIVETQDGHPWGAGEE